MDANDSRGRADAGKAGGSDSSKAARSRGARPPRLKPGPGYSAEEVGAHQCGRLQEAMVELVAERGYNAVAVTALSGRAGVSKRDFYRRFAGKEECFLATYDTIVSRSVRGILAASNGEREWRERLRLEFLAFAGQIVDNPDAARLALVEVFAAGAAAGERMLGADRLFEMLVAKNFALADDLPQLPPLVVKGIVAGCGWAARARLLSGHPRKLVLDGGELMGWALSFCDHEVARLRGLEVGGTPPPPATAARPALGDERAMILAATAKLASSEGYATLTVPRVRAAAGVSRRSFDAHFDGVADCFLATLEMLSDRTLAAAEPLYLEAEDWGRGVHRMIARICQHLAGDPTFADLAFLEVFSPGSETVRWRSEMIAKLAAMLRRGAAPEQRPSVFAAEASIGAMWGVVHRFVATGRGARLPAVAPVLSYLALAPALGGSAAVDAIGAPPSQGVPSRRTFQRWLVRNPFP
jgi:AcrR family transcriptional regulator